MLQIAFKEESGAASWKRGFDPGFPGDFRSYYVALPTAELTDALKRYLENAFSLNGEDYNSKYDLWCVDREVYERAVEFLGTSKVTLSPARRYRFEHRDGVDHVMDWNFEVLTEEQEKNLKEFCDLRDWIKDNMPSC